MATTLAAAEAALRERLGEPAEAQWTPDELRRWLGEGLRDMARRTRHFQDVDTISVSADTGEYTVDDDVIHIMHAFFTPTGQSTMLPLEARAFEAMNAVWGYNQNQSGGYPAVWTTYGYAPSLIIKLYPVPSVGGTLTLHVVRLPAPVVVANDNDTLDAPTGWLEVIYDYAEYMALRKDRDERWQEAFQLYESKIQGMIEMGEYANAPGEFVWTGAGMAPTWLTNEY